MRSLMIVSLLSFLISGSLMAQEYEYVGVKKCKMCHNKPATGAQYKQWSETPHATTMDRLVGEERNDPKCLKCHSTAGGVNPDLIISLTVEEGVSCESCHGPGSKYFPNAIMKSREKSLANGMIIPDEKTCLACHNEESPHYKGFNYEEYNAKILHPIPGK
jgi:hypothetical protein